MNRKVKKRNSILKKVSLTEASPTTTATSTITNSQKSRRISFSNQKSVKEFLPGSNNGTVWLSSYEETADDKTPENHNISTKQMQNRSYSTQINNDNVPKECAMKLRSSKIIHTDEELKISKKRRSKIVLPSTRDKENVLILDNESSQGKFDALYSNEKTIAMDMSIEENISLNQNEHCGDVHEKKNNKSIEISKSECNKLPFSINDSNIVQDKDLNLVPLSLSSSLSLSPPRNQIGVFEPEISDLSLITNELTMLRKSNSLFTKRTSDENLKDGYPSFVLDTKDKEILQEQRNNPRNISNYSFSISSNYNMNVEQEMDCEKDNVKSMNVEKVRRQTINFHKTIEEIEESTNIKNEIEISSGKKNSTICLKENIEIEIENEDMITNQNNNSLTLHSVNKSETSENYKSCTMDNIKMKLETLRKTIINVNENTNKNKISKDETKKQFHNNNNVYSIEDIEEDESLDKCLFNGEIPLKNSYPRNNRQTINFNESIKDCSIPSIITENKTGISLHIDGKNEQMFDINDFDLQQNIDSTLEKKSSNSHTIYLNETFDIEHNKNNNCENTSPNSKQEANFNDNKEFKMKSLLSRRRLNIRNLNCKNESNAEMIENVENSLEAVKLQLSDKCGTVFEKSSKIEGKRKTIHMNEQIEIDDSINFEDTKKFINVTDNNDVKDLTSLDIEDDTTDLIETVRQDCKKTNVKNVNEMELTLESKFALQKPLNQLQINNNVQEVTPIKNSEDLLPTFLYSEYKIQSSSKKFGSSSGKLCIKRDRSPQLRTENEIFESPVLQQSNKKENISTGKKSRIPMSITRSGNKMLKLSNIKTTPSSSNTKIKSDNDHKTRRTIIFSPNNNDMNITTKYPRIVHPSEKKTYQESSHRKNFNHSKLITSNCEEKMKTKKVVEQEQPKQFDTTMEMSECLRSVNLTNKTFAPQIIVTDFKDDNQEKKKGLQNTLHFNENNDLSLSMKTMENNFGIKNTDQKQSSHYCQIQENTPNMDISETKETTSLKFPTKKRKETTKLFSMLNLESLDNLSGLSPLSSDITNLSNITTNKEISDKKSSSCSYSDNSMDYFYNLKSINTKVSTIDDDDGSDDDNDDDYNDRIENSDNEAKALHLNIDTSVSKGDYDNIEQTHISLVDSVQSNNVSNSNVENRSIKPLLESTSKQNQKATEVTELRTINNNKDMNYTRQLNDTASTTSPSMLKLEVDFSYYERNKDTLKRLPKIEDLLDKCLVRLDLSEQKFKLEQLEAKNSTHDPEIPPYEFLWNNYVKTRIKGNNKFDDFFVKPVCPITPCVMLLIRNKIKTEKLNWSLDDTLYMDGIIVFHHTLVSTHKLVFRYNKECVVKCKIKDTIIFDDIQLIQRRFNIRPTSGDILMKTEFLPKMPYILKDYCKTSDNLFTFLDYLNKIIVDADELTKKLLKTIADCQGTLQLNENDELFIIKTISIKSGNTHYKKNILIRVPHINTVSCNHIVTPGLDEFEESIQSLPRGVDFVKEFLFEPQKYFKKRQ